MAFGVQPIIGMRPLFDVAAARWIRRLAQLSVTLRFGGDRLSQSSIPTTSLELWPSWTRFGFPSLSMRQVRAVVSLLNPGEQLQRVMHRIGLDG